MEVTTKVKKSRSEKSKKKAHYGFSNIWISEEEISNTLPSISKTNEQTESLFKNKIKYARLKNLKKRT